MQLTGGSKQAPSHSRLPSMFCQQRCKACTHSYTCTDLCVQTIFCRFQSSKSVIVLGAGRKFPMQAVPLVLHVQHS